jgi:4-amino-4-deoxy-L-arabinose transferase-like glycosyltransferase
MTALALLVLLAGGDACLHLLHGRARGTERLGLAFGLGAGLVSLLLFWAGLAGLPRLLVLAPIAALVAWARSWRTLERPAVDRWAVLSGLLILGLVLANALLAAGSWEGNDAVAVWGLKARVLGQGSLGAYLEDRTRLFSHPEYPLLVPLVESWFELLGAPGRAALVGFHAALLLALHGLLRREGGGARAFAGTAVLGSLPDMVLWAPSGYADVPLALFLAGSALTLHAWLARKDPRDAVLAGVLAALAAWTKKEGIVDLAVQVAFLLAVFRRGALRLLAGHAVAFAALVLPWWALLRFHHVASSDFEPLTVANAHLERLPALARLVLAELASPVDWGFLWVAFAGALALGRFTRERTWLAVAAALPLGLLAAVYLWSRWQPFETHVETSFTRLALAHAPIAVAFVVLRRGPAPRALLVATLVAIAFLWIAPLTDGLWIDECGTYWVVKDGWLSTIDRALRFQGQSPLYYLLARLALVLGGKSELVLRAPSVLAALGALLLLRRLGERLLGAETARAAVLLFVVLVSERAVEARPYALAILLAVATAASVVRWLDTGAPRHAIASAVLGALLLYAHSLFAPVLLVLAIYAWSRNGREKRIPARHARLALVLLALLVAPLGFQLAALALRQRSLHLAGIPPALGVASVFFPPVALAALGLAFLLAYLRGSRWRRPAGDGASWLLVALWHLVPPAAVLALAAVTPLGVAVSRYWSGALPGLALLLALGASAIAARRVRTTAALLLALALSCGLEGRYDDWRGATEELQRAATPGAAVLVVSPFVEGRELAWLTDEEKRSYLLAPFAFYPVDAEITLLPYGERRYAGAVKPVLGRSRIVVVARAETALAWFEGNLWVHGYFSQWSRHGSLSVVTFDPRND